MAETADLCNLRVRGPEFLGEDEGPGGSRCKQRSNPFCRGLKGAHAGESPRKLPTDVSYPAGGLRWHPKTLVVESRDGWQGSALRVCSWLPVAGKCCGFRIYACVMIPEKSPPSRCSLSQSLG